MKGKLLNSPNVTVQISKFFIRAVKSCWGQLWKSFGILVFFTVILATAFYYCEAHLQPDYANWWKDLRWAFFTYLGDPGGFGGNGPITFGGRVVATLLSIVNILIFAVPAGIIATGLADALAQESIEKKCTMISKRYVVLSNQHSASTHLCELFLRISLLPLSK